MSHQIPISDGWIIAIVWVVFFATCAFLIVFTKRGDR